MSPATNPLRARLAEPTAEDSRLWLLVWALVVFISLLSFYVQVLHEQVDRGERFRQAQRHAVQTGTKAPAESFIPMTGIPLAAAILKSFASLLPLVASMDPARTVKSWP